MFPVKNLRLTGILHTADNRTQGKEIRAMDNKNRRENQNSNRTNNQKSNENRTNNQKSNENRN